MSRPFTWRYVGEDATTLLARNAIFKAYALEGNNYAVFRQSELAALRASKASDLPVTHFVDPSEIDQKYYDKSYDVWPDRGGEKGYELFSLGLRDTGFVAIGEVPLFGRERSVVIRRGRRGLVLHTLFCAKEVNFDDEYDLKPGLASDNELELTRALMRAQRGTFDPAGLRDKFQERVLEFVLTRCQAVFPMVAGDATPRTAPVVDIADALRRSIDATRKPPRSEATGRSPRKKDKRQTKQPRPARRNRCRLDLLLGLLAFAEVLVQPSQ
ncbi:MAG: hypothetical protein IT161_24610 [Bryobacterales bacterium]|nr:hypothetical protein [Bryobacterales bacterium]